MNMLVSILEHFQKKCEAVLRGDPRKNKEMVRFSDSFSRADTSPPAKNLTIA
jgi:hypothetical protein